MPFGYNGNILHIDLTNGTLEVENPPETFYRKYLGGSAMGMHYILRDMPKAADPLGPLDTAAVRRIVESTGFFRPDETDVAVELVD